MMPRKLPSTLTNCLEPVADVETIRAAAEAIAQAMERLHGAPFLVNVDHECRLVMINEDRRE